MMSEWFGLDWENKLNELNNVIFNIFDVISDAKKLLLNIVGQLISKI